MPWCWLAWAWVFLGLLAAPVVWAIGAAIAVDRGSQRPESWPFTLAKAVILTVFWVLYWPIHLLRTREERRAAARRWFYNQRLAEAGTAQQNYRAEARKLRAAGYPLSAIAHENAADVMAALADMYREERELTR